MPPPPPAQQGESAIVVAPPLANQVRDFSARAPCIAGASEIPHRDLLKRAPSFTGSGLLLVREVTGEVIPIGYDGMHLGPDVFVYISNANGTSGVATNAGNPFVMVYESALGTTATTIDQCHNMALVGGCNGSTFMAHAVGSLRSLLGRIRALRPRSDRRLS